MAYFGDFTFGIQSTCSFILVVQLMFPLVRFPFLIFLRTVSLLILSEQMQPFILLNNNYCVPSIQHLRSLQISLLFNEIGLIIILNHSEIYNIPILDRV